MSFPLLFPVVSVTCSAEWPLLHCDLNVSHPSLIPLSLRLLTTLLSSSRYPKTSCLIYSHRPQNLTPFSSPSLLLHLYLSSSLTSFPPFDRQKKFSWWKDEFLFNIPQILSLFVSSLSANIQYKKKKKRRKDMATKYPQICIYCWQSDKKNITYTQLLAATMSLISGTTETQPDHKCIYCLYIKLIINTTY